MWTLIRIECKKYLFNKKVAVLFLILFSFFMYMIMTYRATIHSQYYALRTDYVEYVRSKWWPAQDMDHDVKEKALEDYKVYVDTYLPDQDTLLQKVEDAKKDHTLTLPDGEMIAVDTSFLNGLNLDDVWEQRYDFENRGTIFHQILKIELSDDEYSGYLSDQYDYTLVKDNIVEKCIEYNNNAPILNKKGDRSNSHSESELRQITSLAKQNLEGKPLIKGYHLGADYLTSNMQFLPFVLGLFIVTSLYGMFAYEKVRKIDALTLTCKFGKKQSIYAKLITVFLFTSIAWFAFQLVNILLCQMLFSLDGMNVSVFDFLFPSPYGFDYAAYYVHQLIVSYFGTLLFTYVLCFLSQISRPVPTLCLGIIFILFTSFVVITPGNQDYTVFDKIILLMPTQMMSAFTTFYEYISFPLFGTHIVLPNMVYLTLIIGLPLSIAGVYYTARHRQIKN